MWQNLNSPDFKRGKQTDSGNVLVIGRAIGAYLEHCLI